MENIYAKLINKGLKTIEDVPNKLSMQTRLLLPEYEANILKVFYDSTGINIDKLKDELVNITESFTLLNNDDKMTLLFQDIKEEVKEIREEILTPTDVEITPQVLNELGEVIQATVIEVQDVITYGEVIDTIYTYYRRGIELQTIEKVCIESVETTAPIENLNESETSVSDVVVEEAEKIYTQIEVPYIEEISVEVWNEFDFQSVKDAIDLVIENHDPHKGEKEESIILASQQCQIKIFEGFESDCLVEVKHFDCSMTDQATIQGLALTAFMGVSGYTSEETHWKGTGELECYNFEYAQILQLATDMKKHIELCINEFNAERLVILNA